MTDRIQRMLKAVRTVNAPVCTRKFELASEVLKKNTDATPWFKRVLPLIEFLEKMPVLIDEDTLIVGEAASKPFGIELCYEQGMWTKEQLSDMEGENTSWCHVPKEDLEFCKRYIDDPNKVISESLPSREAHYIFANEDLGKLKLSGIGGWPSREFAVKGGVYGVSSMGNFPNLSLAIPLYERVLNEGARSIVDRCKASIESIDYADPELLDKLDYWEGVSRVYEAWIHYANRYADGAEEMAKTASPERAKELTEIAAICRRVPEYPARTFREAIQAFWFSWFMMGSPTDAGGRFDQYMYPFYKADLEAGRITPEEALELLENLKIKTQACHTVRGNNVRDASSGGASWFNFTLGGVDRDGNDATNDLTYMMLEATRETMLPNHTLSVRVHEGTPNKLMQKALELVRTGIGMPAFVSDKEYIGFFTEHGVPLEDARNYALSGCLDGNIPGKTRISGGGFIGNMQILDIFLHNGFSRFNSIDTGIHFGDVRECKSYDEFINLFYEYHRYMIAQYTKMCNISVDVNRRYNQEPFYTALMEGSLENGKEISNMKIGAYDNLQMVSMVGAINVCDALAGIKKLVYEEKKYTMDQLLTALDADWEGYEEMRQDFKKAPKYGNDDDYVDLIVADYYNHFADDFEACDHPFGKYIVAGISITFHQMECKKTYASADGRKFGEILSDGSVSPEHGADFKGPLALLTSAMKINQRRYNATLMNLKFHPTALKTDADLLKLAAMTKTYLTNGGKHVQFNVVDRETLVRAQEDPDAHRDLIVRVAGYSAYFTTLTKIIQDEVIERTGFSGV